ncbi:MAG: heavy metal translocating P-type ATPase [Nanoarchaeota archaeon]|nr:heavy metal translocating P-type ATPase [Nanoarchaeota archaeon]
MKIYLKVYELDSKQAARALKKAVKNEKGIHAVDINFRTSIAKVRFDENIITQHRVKIAFLKAGHIVGIYGKPEQEEIEESIEGVARAEGGQEALEEKEDKVTKVLKKILPFGRKKEAEAQPEAEREEIEEKKEPEVEEAPVEKEAEPEEVVEEEKEELPAGEEKPALKKAVGGFAGMKKSFSQAIERRKEERKKSKEKKRIEKEKKKVELAKKRKIEEKEKEKIRKEREKEKSQFEKKIAQEKEKLERIKQKVEEAKKKAPAQKKEEIITKQAVKKVPGIKQAISLAFEKRRERIKKEKERKKKITLKEIKEKQRQVALKKKSKDLTKTIKIEEKATIPVSVQLDKSVLPEIVEEIIPAVKIQKDEPVEITEEMERLRIKTIFVWIFAVPLLYISIGSHIGLPSTYFIEKYMSIFQFILATPIVAIGYRFYIKGIRSVMNKKLNMYTLIALGTGFVYLYSLFSSVMIMAGREYFRSQLYYGVAGLLVAFIMLGNHLEAKAHAKVIASIKDLLKLRPKQAMILADGEEKLEDIEKVRIGDIVVIKPGENIPVDGKIIAGFSTVDESMMTGEWMPVDKKEEDVVISGTINKSGAFNFKAEKVGQKTTIMQIVHFVMKAYARKAPVEKLADKVSLLFVPIVIGIAFISFIAWIIAGQGFGFALLIAVSVLIIACPSALGLAAPTTVMVAVSLGARQGILLKGTDIIQKMQEIDTFVFDKAGALTQGRPEVTDIIGYGKYNKENILKIAATAENKSEHPFAKAIVHAAKLEDIKLARSQGFKAHPGLGVEAKINKSLVLIGKRKLMLSRNISLKKIEIDLDNLESAGKSAVIVAVGKKAAGIIAFADRIKPYSHEVAAALHKMKKDVIMMTGDNRKTSESIAGWLGINHVLADILPGNKAKEIKKLQAQGKTVAMIGDGINDSAALVQSDVGIAIGTGADIAIESGSIVLMKDDICDVITAVDLSKAAMRKINQNLAWAFLYNLIGIPVAAGILYPSTGWLLSPVIAGAAMAFSSVSVISNSLLLRRFRPRKLKLL